MLYKMVNNGDAGFKNPILELNIQYLWRATRWVQGAEDYINNVTWYCGKHKRPGKAGSVFFFSWQMGPCRTLQSVVPPYRGATSSRQAENSCSSCLGPCHLRLPLMVSNNPSNSIGFYYYSTFTINMVFWRFTYAETQNLTPRKEE